MAIGREQVLAFRLASHGLNRRTKGLVEAAARCGIQETPLGTAALAFHARVDGLSTEKLEKALSKDRTLLALWAMRGAPHVVPATDLGVFTTGALPLDDDSFRHTLGGWARALEQAGLEPFQLLDRLVGAAEKMLDGKSMDVNELRDRLYARVRSLHRIERPESARDDMPEPLFRAIGTTGSGVHRFWPGHRLGDRPHRSMAETRSSADGPGRRHGPSWHAGSCIATGRRPPSISPSGLNAAWRMRNKPSSSSRKSSPR